MGLYTLLSMCHGICQGVMVVFYFLWRHDNSAVTQLSALMAVIATNCWCLLEIWKAKRTSHLKAPPFLSVALLHDASTNTFKFTVHLRGTGLFKTLLIKQEMLEQGIQFIYQQPGHPKVMVLNSDHKDILMKKESVEFAQTWKEEDTDEYSRSAERELIARIEKFAEQFRKMEEAVNQQAAEEEQVTQEQNASMEDDAAEIPAGEPFCNYVHVALPSPCCGTPLRLVCSPDEQQYYSYTPLQVVSTAEEQEYYNDTEQREEQ